MKRRSDPRNLSADASLPNKPWWVLAICWGAIGGLSYLILGTVVEQPGIAAVQLQSDAVPTDKEGVTGPQDDSLGGLLDGLDLKSPVDETSGQSPGQLGSGETTKSADEPDAVATILGKVRDEMLAAGRLLASDEFGESTQLHQQEVMNLIDSLLDAFETGEPTAQPSEENSGSDQKGNAGEEKAGTEALSGSQTSDSNEADASESESGEESGAAQTGKRSGEGAGQESDHGESDNGDASPTPPVRRPLNVRGEAIWGHLPEQRRGLLRAETPTEYLPQYADQISRYFEALAELAQEEDR